VRAKSNTTFERGTAKRNGQKKLAHL